MSTFKCEVVPVSMERHPNADTLSIVQVFGFPVLVRTADWEGKSRGVYIPVDSIVPDVPEFAFLDGKRRIKAKKLRGVFSMGLLTPARDGWEIGQDVTADLGVTRYDPDLFAEPLSTSGEDAPEPGGLAPKYTDIESLRRHKHVLQHGERVIVTEKIHGANARYLVDGGVLHAGSRTRWKAEGGNIWRRAAEACDLINRIPEGVVVYGEVYGQVQDLKYGAAAGQCLFRAFDVFDRERGRYLDADALTEALARFGIERAPVIFDGPYGYEIMEAIAEADSRVAAGQLQEGIVIRPAAERVEHMGRVILKLHSQRYLLRKGAWMHPRPKHRHLAYPPPSKAERAARDAAALVGARVVTREQVEQERAKPKAASRPARRMAEVLPVELREPDAGQWVRR